MAIEGRGGIPRILRLVPDAVGRDVDLRFTSKFIQLSSEGAFPVRVYFTQPDFTANANYIELPATTGFFEGPVEAQKIWVRGVGGAGSLVGIFYARRG